MGLFDNFVGNLQGLVSGQPGAASKLFADAFADVGGYQGILNQLQQSGLGPKVESWLSTNAGNLPVTPDEINAALGDQRLQELATKFGIPLDQVSALIAQHLPKAVDESSPNGVLEPPSPDPAA